jgi:hypothetical protein
MCPASVGKKRSPKIAFSTIETLKERLHEVAQAILGTVIGEYL